MTKQVMSETSFPVSWNVTEEAKPNTKDALPVISVASHVIVSDNKTTRC